MQAHMLAHPQAGEMHEAAFKCVFPEPLCTESAPLNEPSHTMQAKNEELARKSHALSEEDFEAMRAEFQSRLEAAERKVLRARIMGLQASRLMKLP